MSESTELKLEDQAILAGKIDRLVTNLWKKGAASVTKAAVETRLLLLTEYWAKFNEVHKDLRKYREKLADKSYFKDNLYDKTEEIYIDRRTELNELLNERSGASSVLTKKETNDKSNPFKNFDKLPVPQFKGTYDDWPSFQDTFKSMLSKSPDLSGADKLLYLKMCVRDSPAEHHIKELPVTNDNYDRAWNILVKRFENKRVIIRTCLEKCFAVPKMSADSASGLESILQCMNSTANKLETLGRSLTNSEDFVVHFIINLLDDASRTKWEEEMSGVLEPASLESLLQFLDRRLLTLKSSPPESTKPKPKTQEKRSENVKRAARVYHLKSDDHKPRKEQSLCALCNESHNLMFCDKYKSKSPAARKNKVEELGLCINCLSAHKTSACFSKKRCFVCHEKHHSSLHDAYKSLDEPANKSKAAHLINDCRNNNHFVMLATANALVEDRFGNRHPVRLLIDQGSQVSMVTERLIQRLKLPRTRTPTDIYGVGCQKNSSTRGWATVTLWSSNLQEKLLTNTLILPKLSCYTHSAQDINDWPHLKGLEFADPDPTVKSSIDILLGADVYPAIILKGLRKGDVLQPVAQRTIFGWILSGSTSRNPATRVVQSHLTSIGDPLLEVVKKFWEQEEIPSEKPIPTSDEQECELHFQTTHARNSEGRYIVRLPFAKAKPDFRASRQAAFKALKPMERKFQLDPELKNLYTDFSEKNESQNEESDSNQTTKKQHSQNSVVRSMKDHVNFSKSQGKSAKDDTASSQTSSSQVQSVPVNRGHNLTSQIASSAEVTEALKERLREKQKVIETTPQPDIFFVKELTQRLSSKLAGGPGGVLPALIPLPQPLSCDKKQTNNTSNTGTSKDSNTDNKELLAILEGDVDPDWSNLKPPTLTEEGKRPVKVESSGYNTLPKLNPSIERELALKQLLELLIASSKKSASNKKKTSKPAASKAFKEAKIKTTSNAEKEVNVDESNTSNKPENESTDSVPPLEQKKDTELQDSRLDESRSGRKRKLTEKARESEQQRSIVKRQKVYKGKVSVNKKQSQAIETQADTDLTSDNQSKETTLSDNENNADVTKREEIINKQITNNNKMDSTPEKPEKASTKTANQNLSKKSSQSIAKKNIAAKKVLKQNMPPNKKAAALTTKLNTPAAEIDRLLQDKSVVNLLYDVEQSDKKRLVNKSQAKQNYLDMQKVQRELKLRKKLMEEKADQIPSKPTNLSASQEFILPAKIRNAANASIIVRRHSSSSFSSASASPRVSVDTPEKVETIKVEEGGSHALRSTKRRLSQEEKTTTIAKKSKKKAVQKSDTALDTIVEISKDKAVASTRPSKKTDSKKSEKNAKQPEAEEIGKIVTRSNGTATGKITSKTKKSTKNKVTFARTSEQDNNEDSSKGEDELSACLAEAANALSVVNAGTRSGISAVTRKGKANANVAKSLESDKTKMETRSQFSNKEISVCRHGNLVQLILTPSSSTTIQNALTLQVMQEFCETLSILKKDDDCRLVVLTSTGSSFCEGLELSTLLHTNKEERRIRAQELADAVKGFIKTLASFDKPIVAGVQGSAVGLGLTMLPLFDLVIASDKATFNTRYGKLGQIAEGAAIFTLSHIVGSAITTELLIGGRTLTASEALKAGLVTRVLWPDKFPTELLAALKPISEQSSQSMEATKAVLRHSLREKLDAALEFETFSLIKHWCSAECQTAIKAYINGEIQ